MKNLTSIGAQICRYQFATEIIANLHLLELVPDNKEMLEKAVDETVRIIRRVELDEAYIPDYKITIDAEKRRGKRRKKPDYLN